LELKIDIELGNLVKKTLDKNKGSFIDQYHNVVSRVYIAPKVRQSVRKITFSRCPLFQEIQDKHFWETLKILDRAVQYLKQNPEI